MDSRIANPVPRARDVLQVITIKQLTYLYKSDELCLSNLNRLFGRRGSRRVLALQNRTYSTVNCCKAGFSAPSQPGKNCHTAGEEFAQADVLHCPEIQEFLAKFSFLEQKN